MKLFKFLKRMTDPLQMKIAIVGHFFDSTTEVEDKVFNCKVSIHHSINENPEKFKEYHGLLCWHEDVYNEEFFQKCENLKGLVRVGAGFDNVDLEAASKRKIIVSNTPKYGRGEVADTAMSLLLSLTRKTFELGKKIKDQGKYNEGRAEFRGSTRMFGKTLGIIGFGRLGREMAKRAQGFGMKIVFYDPFVQEFDANQFQRFEEIDGLLYISDFISIHCFLSKDTYHLINKETILKMKKGVYIVNTSRGGVIDENDLAEFLRNGHIAGAGLDVLEKEPYQGHLQEVPNLIITPHCAYFSEESYIEMRMMASEELKRILQGEEPKAIVNRELLKRFN